MIGTRGPFRRFICLCGFLGILFGIETFIVSTKIYFLSFSLLISADSSNKEESY